jgi:hypothetical protein
MKMYPVGWQIYAWQEKASGRTFFSLKPTVFTPYGRKNNCWFVGKKSSPTSFSMPGINLPADRNTYSIETGDRLGSS